MSLAVIRKALDFVLSLVLFLAGPLLLAERSGRGLVMEAHLLLHFPHCICTWCICTRPLRVHNARKGSRYQTGPGAYKQTFQTRLFQPETHHCFIPTRRAKPFPTPWTSVFLSCDISFPSGPLKQTGITGRRKCWDSYRKRVINK